MNIIEMKKWGIQVLRENQIEDVTIQVKRLLAYVLGMDTKDFIKEETKIVMPKQEQIFKKYIQEIVKGKPIQYITHIQEFMKLSFYVNEHVLIPQPDTECLVEEVIKIGEKCEKPKILDMCTGSGCIGISLATYLPDSSIWMSDISKKALEIARKNIKNNQLEGQVTCIQSDMFKQIPQEKMWDILVSNPPYISKEELKELPLSVKQEPAIALDGGNDGLDFYRIILKEAPKYVKKEGYVCLEIGYEQKIAVEKIVKEEGFYQEVTCIQDLAKRDRVIIAKLK